MKKELRLAGPSSFRQCGVIVSFYRHIFVDAFYRHLLLLAFIAHF